MTLHKLYKHINKEIIYERASAPYSGFLYITIRLSLVSDKIRWIATSSMSGSVSIWTSDLAVELIIYELKESFCGAYIEKGLGLFWAKSKRNKEILWMENSLHWPLLSIHRERQKWQTGLFSVHRDGQ